MTDALVRLAVDDQVATVTLDSPHNRNALSARLIDELGRALDAAEASDPRAIVLRHEGPAFCSGADLKERATDGVPDSTPFVRILERLMDTPRPTIAAVAGAVRAGGLGLMAACDLVVVAPEVTFALPEVRVGVAPAIVLVPLVRRVPASQLVATTLTGEPIDAERARQIGLVTHVSDDVAATVAELCAAVRRGARRAVAESKAALWSLPGRPRGEALAAMQALSEELFRGPDAREGMRAFAEGRQPDWR